MIRTQIQLTESQARALKAQAARSGLSVAELIRRSINQALKSNGISDEERRRRAIAIGGQFHGPPDLSTEHDRYFAEAASE